MSCNGCRLLRRGCSEKCPLRPCLEWIDTPQAQAHATLFVSKFFGRSDLIAFISAVPDAKKPALFQSLLYEACGRTVNPVNGAVGLLSTGNWQVCQAAVETVLAGGTLRPMFGVGIPSPEPHPWSFRQQIKKMTITPSISRLHSPFICCPLKIYSSSSLPLAHKSLRNQRSPTSYPCIRAIELDQNTIVAISVGVVSVAIGIGVPVFYENQIDNAAKRDNTQPCFPCSGSGAQRCRFCLGTGNVSVELGGGDKEVSRCINCDGAGSLTCTTCQGSGIQPRYLDRREFKDDD